MSAFCRNCGASAENVQFCTSCGQNQSERPVYAPALQSRQESGPSTGWLVAGWIGAVMLPVLGVAVSIWAMIKGKVGVGIGMLVTSIIFWSFWMSAGGF